MAFKDFFKYEKRQDAQDEKISKKKAKDKANYMEWAKVQKEDADFAQALESLEKAVKEYDLLESKHSAALMDIRNKKREIENLMEENQHQFFKKKQTLSLFGYEVGYRNNTKVTTDKDRFSLEKYLEEFDESTIAFNLSRQTMKESQRSKTMRKKLEELGINVGIEKEYFITAQKYLL